MQNHFIKQLIARAKNQRQLEQGSNLFHQNDPVSTVFIVEEGSVELTRHLLDGSTLILQRASRHNILAEASIYSDFYHCNAAIISPSTVFEISKPAFMRLLQEEKALAHLWSSHLAKEVQSARFRSEILTRKTVAERLDGWLNWQGDNLPSKGQWKSVAAEIGVSPEALYRELAKRRS